MLLLLAALSVQGQELGLSYLLKSSSPDSVEIDDETFYRIAGSVIFPVNKYGIDRRSAFYRELTEVALPRLRDRNFTI